MELKLRSLAIPLVLLVLAVTARAQYVPPVGGGGGPISGGAISGTTGTFTGNVQVGNTVPRPGVKPAGSLDVGGALYGDGTQLIRPTIAAVPPSNSGFVTNLFSESEALSNAQTWPDFNGGVARVALVDWGPGGNKTSSLITQNATANQNYGFVRVLPALPNQNYNVSIWLKYKDIQFAQVNMVFDSTNHNTWFDVQNGALATAGSGTSGRRIDLDPNGYYRCSFYFVTGASTATMTFYTFITSADGTTAAGVVGKGTYFGAVQLTMGSNWLPYAPTNIPRVQTIPPSGLMPTPLMGWNGAKTCTYPCITDTIIRANADALVANGLAAKGYKYVIEDNGWQQATRDANGNLQANATYFPSGMKASCDYLHSKGMLCGGYTGPGAIACATPVLPASLHYEYMDAALFASFGWDYLFHDYCNYSYADSLEVQAYGALGLREIGQRMGLAIRAAGRPMVYSISAGTGTHSEQWSPAAGGDIWTAALDNYPVWADWTSVFDAQSGIATYAGPGNWQDPGLIVCDLGSTTATECQTQFSFLAIINSVLKIGSDVTAMTAGTLSTLGNTEVIAVDQDATHAMGAKASSVSCGGATCEVWAKQLTGTNTCAILLLNRGSSASDITATFATIASAVSGCGSGPYTTTRDLWAHSSLGTLTTNYTATAVPAHGVAMIRVAQ